MILMNYLSAKELLKYKTGIFRALTIKEIEDNKIPADLEDFIKIWKYSTSFYTDYNNISNHELLCSGKDSYTHITSPIRRLVDLINMILIQKINNMNKLSHDSIEFSNKWLLQIDYINKTMRSIKKIQGDSSMIDALSNNKIDIKNIYKGTILEKIERTNSIYHYTVYLNNVNLISWFNSPVNFNEYENHEFKIFIFEKESSLKKKIRLQKL